MLWCNENQSRKFRLQPRIMGGGIHVALSTGSGSHLTQSWPQTQQKAINIDRRQK